MHLSDDQFLEIINDLIGDNVTNALFDLVESGHVQTAVNPNGEIVYVSTGKPLEL
jgi:hypothetical protein